MVKGLGQILELLRSRPNQTLVDRYLALAAELPSDDEKIARVLDLARELIPHWPKEALRLAHLVHRGNTSHLGAFDVMIDALQARGRYAKAEVLRIERDRVAASAIVGDGEQALAPKTSSIDLNRFRLELHVHGEPEPPPIQPATDGGGGGWARKGAPVVTQDLGALSSDGEGGGHHPSALAVTAPPLGDLKFVDGWREGEGTNLDRLLADDDDPHLQDSPGQQDPEVAMGAVRRLAGSPEPNHPEAHAAVGGRPSHRSKLPKGGAARRAAAGKRPGAVAPPAGAALPGPAVPPPAAPPAVAMATAQVPLDPWAIVLAAAASLRVAWPQAVGPPVVAPAAPPSPAPVMAAGAESAAPLPQPPAPAASPAPVSEDPNVPMAAAAEIFDLLWRQGFTAEAEGVLEQASPSQRRADWWRQRQVQLRMRQPAATPAAAQPESLRTTVVSQPPQEEPAAAIPAAWSPPVESQPVTLFEIEAPPVLDPLPPPPPSPWTAARAARALAGDGEEMALIERELAADGEGLDRASRAQRFAELFSSQVAAPLAVMMERLELARHSPALWGQYLECLLADRGGRIALREVRRTLATRPQLGWARVANAQLPAIWQAAALRGFTWEESDGVEALLKALAAPPRSRLAALIASGFD